MRERKHRGLSIRDASALSLATVLLATFSEPRHLGEDERLGMVRLGNLDEEVGCLLVEYLL
jgi:hypothetical protein